MKINTMTIMDLESIKDTLVSDFDDFWSYNVLFQELSNENSTYIVAKDNDNNIVGFAGVSFIIDEANIMNIVTKKDVRKQGIGTSLLEELINISKEKKMSCITLEVNENNSNALKLYNKFGFEILGFRKKYYNGIDNAIIMTLHF